MFESIKQYLQDWSDACEYAAECWPDTPILHANQVQLREPYTALATIAIVCFLIWVTNERRLARRRNRSAAAATTRLHIETLIEDVKQEAPASKLAA